MIKTHKEKVSFNKKFDRVYVLAGNLREYDYFKRTQSKDVDFVYVSEVEYLRGLQMIPYVIVGSFSERLDTTIILRELYTREHVEVGKYL